MGEYLSTPNKEKHSSDGQNEQLRYGASGMQGWRKGMEDAHITALDIIEGEVSLFGVFDGHGGVEVAKYCEVHLIDELKNNDHFKRKDYKNALFETFVGIDRMLLTDSAKKEL